MNRFDPTEFESAIYAIPAHDREIWVKVGAGINNTMGEAGKSLFMSWSATAANFKQRDAEDVWKSFKPGVGVTKGTVFHMALERGWTAPRQAKRPPGIYGTNPGRQTLDQSAHAGTTANPKTWKRIQSVAQGVVQLDHPTAEPIRRYLINRGLADILNDLPDPAVLGSHPALEYWQDRQLIGMFPAQMARVQAPNGATATMHRTYLTDDGHKAPVTDPKKIMTPIYQGATQGAAIRLYQADDILGVAEGVETALAVRLATRMPVWAAVTAGGLEHLLLPNSIRTVHVWADLDRSGTGQKSAEVLAKRLTMEGRTVFIHCPPGPIPDGAKGVDWLDIWSSERCQS